MKKLTTILLAFVLVLSLTACDTNTSLNADNDNQSINESADNDADKETINTDDTASEGAADIVDKNELYSELAELREWKSKTEFFFTADGLDFQIVAYKAAIAYLSGDREALSQYLIDPESEVGLTEDSVDLTGEIEYMVFKLPPPDYASDEGNEIRLAVYQFLIKGDDRVAYLDIGLIKNNDSWMVDYIYFQG
jgi:hypothetical protein